jgi:uncharacterized membrane protein HdeD (DUF308 family)
MAMSKMRRLGNIALSVLMVGACVYLLAKPDEAPLLVAFGLGLWLLISGIERLVYYFTMARHMVGGLLLLFIALITIDIGGFALLLSSQPKLSIVLYLVGYNTFTALINIVRVVESKMIDSHWRMSLFHSLVNLALAIACIVFINSDKIVIAIFCIGLFYQACVRFIRAVRPTEIIYIQ